MGGEFGAVRGDGAGWLDPPGEQVGLAMGVAAAREESARVWGVGGLCLNFRSSRGFLQNWQGMRWALGVRAGERVDALIDTNRGGF